MTNFPVAIQSGLTSPHPALSRVRVPSVHIWCALAGLVLLLFPLGSVGSANAEGMVWATALTLGFLGAHSLYAAHAAGLNMWLAPGPLLMLYFGLRYGCGALTTFYCEYYPWRTFPALRTAQHHNGIWDNLPSACHLILLFAFGMYIGLGLRTNRLLGCLPRLRWPIAVPKLQTSLVLLTPVGIAALTIITGGEESSLAGTVLTFGAMVYPAILLASYWFFTARTYASRLRWGIFLLLACGGSLPPALKSGQMFTFLTPLVMLFLGRLLATGSPPWKLLLALSPILFHIVLPMTAFYKHAKLPGRSVEERVDRAYQMFKAADASGRLELTLERTVLRSSGVFLPAVYSQYFPRVYPFEWGRTFAVEATSLVPRLLWPEKPNVSRELNLYSVRVRILSEGHGSAVFDAISEYYVNFGAVGVFLLSIVHGFYWKLLHDWLAYRVHYLLGISMFLYLCVVNEGFFGVGFILMTHVKAVGLWLFLLYLCSKRHGPGSYAAARRTLG